MANPNKISITFEIGDEDVTVDANVNAPLLAAIEKALADSDNTGRKPDAWQAMKNGKPLDSKKKVEDLGLTDGETIELSLKTGAGG